MVTGSLQIKKDKYYAVINLTDETGARKQKWVPTGLSVSGHNKRAAQKILSELIEKYEQLPATVRMQGKINFLDYVRAWTDAAEYTYDRITYEGYKNCVDAHIIPYFSSVSPSISIQEVTPDHIQAFATHLSRCGNVKNGAGLAPKSVRNYLTILSQIFDDAVAKKKIKENPCRLIKRPKKVKFRPSFYDAEQSRALFDAFENEPIGPMIIVTTVYGLRRSEILGLKWDSVDFRNKQVTINHVVSRFKTVVEKDDTKTESSRRTYPMPPPIEAILREELARKKRNRAAFKDAYVDTDYVFTWDNGKPYAPDYLTRKFKQLLRKHGLPEIRLHDLRHSCASMLLEKGYNLKDVQAWLGHADISTTGNIYGHLTNRHLSAVGEDLCGSLIVPKSE